MLGMKILKRQKNRKILVLRIKNSHDEKKRILLLMMKKSSCGRKE
jgi:hypothetical protein